MVTESINTIKIYPNSDNMAGEEQIKSIAETLENIAVGNYYYCPHCGSYGDWDNAHNPEYESEDDECDTPEYICPECGSDEISDMTMDDYFSDDGIYDIEYRVDRKDADYIRSVRVCVAFGGPNIYIDTGDCKVKCAWWFDYCETNISERVAREITEVFNEFWNC